MNLWCLTVGFGLEDAASGRVEVITLQEVKLTVSEYRSFDIRAAALGYACFGVPQAGLVWVNGSFFGSCYAGQDGRRLDCLKELLVCVGTRSALTAFSPGGRLE